MKIILTTHGGLGNQIFQVYFGLLMCKNPSNLVVSHNDGYSHKFKLAEEFNFFEQPSKVEKFIASLRLGKLIEKLTKGRLAYFYWGKRCFCDGYFQNPDLFEKFSSKERKDAINFLKVKFRIVDECNSDSLWHLRLGDFFKTNEEKIEYLNSVFACCSETVNIITNEEVLVRQYLRENDIMKFNVINTSEMSGSDILRLMAKYKKIRSNNSTLALWAGVFGNSELVLSDQKLITFFTRCSASL
jgi:hypothetical protein